MADKKHPDDLFKGQPDTAPARDTLADAQASVLVLGCTGSGKQSGPGALLGMALTPPALLTSAKPLTRKRPRRSR